jgi:O-antigen/teichoic acid export membrane protein
VALMRGLRGKAALKGLQKRLWGVGLARGATVALLVNLTGVALGFASQLVLARVLGAEQFGIYAYVMAWVTILSLFATLGYSDGLMRLVPTYCVAERWALLRGLIRYSATSVLIAGFGIVGVGAAAMMLLSDRLSPELRHTFLLGFATVPIFALAQTRSCLARSLGRVFSALAPNAIIRQLIIVSVLPFLAMGLDQVIRAPTAMAISLLGGLLALLLLTTSSRSAYPSSLRSAPIANDRSLWRRTSLHLLLVAGTQQCMNQSDILLLGWLADTTTAGLYIVANQITNVTILALIAMNQLIAPTISSMYAANDIAGLQKIATSTSWWVFGFSLLVIVPVFLFSAVLLSVFFGEHFARAASALRIIMIGQAINCSFGAIHFLLTMTGRHFKALAVFGGMAVVNVALNVALVPLYGIEGAAIAKAFTLFGWNITMAIIVFKDLKIVAGIYSTIDGLWSNRPKIGGFR